MEDYGMQEGFWPELIIILSVVMLLVGIIPAIFRYKMGADKKKWFSYNHINKLHKRIDWTLRIVAILSMIASVILFHNQLILVSIILTFLVVSQISTQAFIEWKFSENRRNFQVSLIQLSLTFITFIGLFFWLEYFF